MDCPNVIHWFAYYLLLTFEVTSCVDASWVIADNTHLSRREVSKRSSNETQGKTLSVEEFQITSTVNIKFSETNVKSALYNPSSNGTEVKFEIQLPEDAFISNFTIETEEKIFVGKVLPKKEAEKVYEEAKEKKKTAGIVGDEGQVKVADRKMTLFSIAVAVKPQARVIFRLSYQQILMRIQGVYELMINVFPGQVLEGLKVEVLLYEPQGIRWLTVDPPYSGSNNVVGTSVVELHPSDYVKEVIYKPSLTEQTAASPTHGISGMLVTRYDVFATADDGYVVTADEFFAYYFSPNETDYEPLGKIITFVIDISGSMSGEKILQTKEATVAILSQLRAIDKFMLILFDDQLIFWPNERVPVAASSKNLENSKQFAQKNLEARGATDIHLGLTTACKILSGVPGQTGSKLVAFLTDGMPSSGVTNVTHILQDVFHESQKEMSIFSLGFGDDVNFELLESISYGTSAFPKKIYLGTDASLQLQNFFKEISNPLMYNIRFALDGEVDVATQLYFPQYFAGSEIVIVGKLSSPAKKKFSMSMSGETSESITFTKSVDLSNDDVEKEEVKFRKGFFERLFVHFKIKNWLQERVVAVDNQEREDIEGYIEKLALEYQLVTPLTSLVVVAEDESLNQSQVIKSSSQDHASDMPYFGTSRASHTKFSLFPCLFYSVMFKLVDVLGTCLFCI